MTKHQERSSITLRKIKDAGLCLFARHGYHATSIDEIMREAGYTKGAFYGHFKSKEELFLAIMDERMLKHQTEIMDSFWVHEDDGLKTVSHHLEYILQQAQDDSWASIYFEFLANTRRNPEVQKKLAYMYSKWREFVIGFFQSLQDKGLIQINMDIQLLSATVIALFDGFNIQSYVDPNEDSRKHIQIISHLLGVTP
ncbi:TetR/AcrR family transcriptional regulator [Thermoactinomyces sp. DSM 45892]|uniref:TetR/AcrR family transcriptional regulator n=1 Tax=Thermoactinomyces sp. DSM 45892 TaxID=1882753 RepID=UPI00089CAEC8|nr:TetR/AcrR family transcriptional regulator [Thermoactinomyces sp. DSM 45892]SDY86661.1 transcriptional regulator, TetR family [Thermoactinomyces sp. DSM 45892]